MYKKHSNLPHIDIKHHYQFMTYRTHACVDNYLKRLSKQSIPNNRKQLLMDEYLDKSELGAVINDDVLTFLSHFIKNYDQDLYDLIAFCIMPNHVHLLIKPLIDLDKIMQKLKGGNSKLINEKLNQTGRFWAAYY